jgi:DNA replication protein DnaC
MLVAQTFEKLYDLRLGVLARAYQEQIDAGDVGNLSFDDRLGLLVDREWTTRQETKTHNRLKKARLKQQARWEDTDYRHPRGLEKQVMLDLYTCQWVKAKRNIIFTGPTGLGKSWLACALADKACREGYTSYYARVPTFLHELAIARADGSYLKQLAALSKIDVLILDDWALCAVEGDSLQAILDVIDDRTGKRSTIVTSQAPVSKWHDMFGDPSTADALLDRILGSAQEIKLKGESIRKSVKKSGA